MFFVQGAEKLNILQKLYYHYGFLIVKRLKTYEHFINKKYSYLGNPIRIKIVLMKTCLRYEIFINVWLCFVHNFKQALIL